MNNVRAEQARSYCDMIRSDQTCALMMALATESDPRCKYWRDEPRQCRYFELHVMGGGRKRKER